MTVSGAVLCGGASRRMGRDKALLEVDGVAMAVRVAKALRAGGCERVVAIGGDAVRLEGLGLAVVADGWPGEGPLGAVATALAAAGADTAVVVAPCDLVDPSADLVAGLLAALTHAGDGIDAAVPFVAGRREWTTSAWRAHPQLVVDLERVLGDGARRLDAVESLVRWVAVTGIDPGGVLDADRPEDLDGR